MEENSTLDETILLVEDDSATRLVLRRGLQMAGYNVIEASNGEEGLKQALECHPALILCDWVMPLMDGLEVCRRVKASPELATTFLILLTSREGVADRVAGLDAGADDFLNKPIEPNELLARVRAGLRLHRSQRDLTQANQKLSLALSDLQRTQAQLVQSEKMSSLGQLVAGVAHEINNPISVIEGNLSHANSYLAHLLEFVQIYEQHCPNLVPEIEEYAQAIDWEFIKSDFPKVLEAMKIGASRIRDVVLSLRNFSRLDEAEMKRVNIHEGLESTLLMLQHCCQAQGDYLGIQVIKEYGDLPQVECYPSQLNQVFLNILNNAIDALEQKRKGQPNLPNSQDVILSSSNQTINYSALLPLVEQPSVSAIERNLDAFPSGSYCSTQPVMEFEENHLKVLDVEIPEMPIPTQDLPCITIRTALIKGGCEQTTNNEQLSNDYVCIGIADNGLGIPVSIQKRLFDPFFTTKPVGKGTGLGLSISYQIIVERHGGELYCYSQPGQGTNFLIKIPVNQPSAPEPIWQ